MSAIRGLRFSWLGSEVSSDIHYNKVLAYLEGSRMGASSQRHYCIRVTKQKSTKIPSNSRTEKSLPKP